MACSQHALKLMLTLPKTDTFECRSTIVHCYKGFLESGSSAVPCIKCWDRSEIVFVRRSATQWLYKSQKP